MGSVIALSGTPGTGKSVVGQLLAVELGIQCLELNQIILEQRLYLGEDADRETLIADIEKVREYLLNTIEEGKNRYVVVGHFADEVPKDLLEVLIVLRCNPVILSQRLQKKGWSVGKIVENLQAELLGECTAQAIARHDLGQIFELDTSEKNPQETVETINTILAGKGSNFAVGHISWLRSLDEQLVYQIMEKNMLPS